MISLLVVCGHAVLNVAFGYILLSHRRHERNWTETLLMSALLGMYAETLLVATMMFLGVSLAAAGLATVAGMGVVAIAACYRGRLHFTRLSLERPEWYEWALLAAIGEKILFAAWQIVYTHTYFEDALTLWSGRARALFGEVNWSLDSTSPFFLGDHIGFANYPLQTVIWRALSAKANGEWNEIVSRADSLIFFIVILGTTWFAVRRFSGVRWLAAAAVFVLSAVPLHVWHAAAGYNDIAVEAFVVVALAALLRGEWFLGGVMVAGAVWAKNDALVLYFPSLLSAVCLLQRQKEGPLNWRNVVWFLTGFATIAPWLIFKYVHTLGITAATVEVAWHSDAPRLLWIALMEDATSGIFWICIFACTVYGCVAMLKDRTGRALISAFLISAGTIAFIFSSTPAYLFLADKTTIHRVLLQFSGMAILVAANGMSLKIQSEPPKSRSRLRDGKRKKNRAII